jgi:hypothetical protein
MLNLVVKIDKGNIYELVWDNGCFTCNKDRCEKNLITKSVENENITANYENCFEIYKPDENKEPKFFEPKFYITWFGSDIDKRQLRTAGLAMTKFKPYISESFTSSIKDLF